ncbi:MAG TPA: cation:proton antiporter [Gemmatimonadales bacterium]|nr:cation:proton antiporter [Gemmatimonadales bacterium]
MNALTAIGVILLLALLAGHAAKLVRVPEVTGYILAGILVGPSALGLITHENLQGLSVFSEIALGMILFSIGAVFDLSGIGRLGRGVLRLTIIESTLASVIVAAGAKIAGQPWPVALLLGAISIETAAASTLMVIREYNASGPLTDTLIGVIAIDNIICLVSFSLIAAGLDLHTSALTGRGALAAWGTTLFTLAWQLVGSVALGYLVGLLLAQWASRAVEHGETLILLSGCILLTVGVASAIDLFPLVASLAVGATMVNLTDRSRSLFAAVGRTDPPLYAIFFVIAGADLRLGLLKSLGLVGVIYVVGRAVGKLTGVRLAAGRIDAPPHVRELLGYSMLSQAGLAIGLVLTTRERFPALAPTITAVVLGAITIFELVGPLAARAALMRAKETYPDEAEGVAG